MGSFKFVEEFTVKSRVLSTLNHSIKQINEIELEHVMTYPNCLLGKLATRDGYSGPEHVPLSQECIGIIASLLLGEYMQ